MAESLYELSATSNKGQLLSLDQYRGKVVLVVNTASKCGFTPQYKGLEQLWKDYRDQGLVILGFPCDQFGHQEPGDDAEIASFCEMNFGVSFPLMAKVEVNGPGTHPVFGFLKTKSPGAIGDGIKWNFTKFLVGRDGSKVKRYAPTVEPDQLRRDIEAALASNA